MNEKRLTCDADCKEIKPGTVIYSLGAPGSIPQRCGKFVRAYATGVRAGATKTRPDGWLCGFDTFYLVAGRAAAFHEAERRAQELVTLIRETRLRGR